MAPPSTNKKGEGTESGIERRGHRGGQGERLALAAHLGFGQIAFLGTNVLAAKGKGGCWRVEFSTGCGV